MGCGVGSCRMDGGNLVLCLWLGGLHGCLVGDLGERVGVAWGFSVWIDSYILEKYYRGGEVIGKNCLGSLNSRWECGVIFGWGVGGSRGVVPWTVLHTVLRVNQTNLGIPDNLEPRPKQGEEKDHPPWKGGLGAFEASGESSSFCKDETCKQTAVSNRAPGESPKGGKKTGGKVALRSF